MKLKTLLIISVITTPLFILIMALHSQPLKVEGVTPLGIIDLEMAGTVARAMEIYKNWSPDLIITARRNIYIDFLFLVSYGTFLYTATLSLAKWFDNPFKKIGIVISILSVVAAAFDALENILLLSTLAAHFKKEIVASTFIFSSIKFIIAGVAILYIMLSLLLRLFIAKKKIISLQD